jgi:hypothetical protein
MWEGRRHEDKPGRRTYSATSVGKRPVCPRVSPQAPCLHRLKPPCQKGIGAPKLEMGFFGGNLWRGKCKLFRRDILRRITFHAGRI